MDRNKHLNKLSERLNNLYPDAEDKEGLGVTHWKGKKIIPVKEWKKIALVEGGLGFRSSVCSFFLTALLRLRYNMKDVQSTRGINQYIHIMTVTRCQEPMNTNSRLIVQKGSFRPPKLSYGRQELKKDEPKQKKKTLLRFGLKNTRNC